MHNSMFTTCGRAGHGGLVWFTGTSSSQGLTTVLLEMILKTFHKHYYLGVFLFSTFYALVNFLMLTNKIKDTLGFFFQ